MGPAAPAAVSSRGSSGCCSWLVFKVLESSGKDAICSRPLCTWMYAKSASKSAIIVEEKDSGNYEKKRRTSGRVISSPAGMSGSASPGPPRGEPPPRPAQEPEEEAEDDEVLLLESASRGPRASTVGFAADEDEDDDYDDERGAQAREARSSSAHAQVESCKSSRSSSAKEDNNASSEANGGGSSTNVRVCCRFRPANKVEEAEGASKAVTFGDDGASVTLHSKEDAKFTFDRVFKEDSLQEDVYEYCAKPLVRDVLDGYNCTIFAYGQTGSGKTHTMMGPNGGKVSGADGGADLRGVVPRIAEDVFHAMSDADADTEFMIKVSFVEIYMERIRDLLNPSARNQNLRVRDVKGRGVTLEGAEEVYVSSARELLKVAAKGNASRAIASTRMNQDSSRSHSVFMITVSQRKTRSTLLSKTGKLFLVDLAGSEMVKKTGATSGVLEEAKTINRSLSALGNVIKALVEGAKHVPYRDSKLTRCLQDSLGGNSKTSLIITCSGFAYNAVETLSTLRFGTRAKRIKNKPKVNQEFSVAEYKAMVAQSRDSLLMMVKYARSLEASLGIEVAQSPVREMKGSRGGFAISAEALEHALQRECVQLSSIPCVDAPHASGASTFPQKVKKAQQREQHEQQLEQHEQHLEQHEQHLEQQQQQQQQQQHEKCPEDARYPPSSSPGLEADEASVASKDSLLRRAEEALTKALERVETLRAKADEAQVEADIAKDALEGVRTRNLELEDQLAASSKAQADLVERVAKLELFQQQAEFKEKETLLTLRGLESENKVLKQHLGGGDDDDFFAAGTTVRSAAPSGTPVPPGGARERDEAIEAAVSSPRTSRELRRGSLGSQGSPNSSQRRLRRRSTSLQDVKAGSTISSQEALLKSDLMHITEKYIQLRLEHLEAQELLAASDNADLSELTDTLRTEREHNSQLNARIRKQNAKLEVAQQNEVLGRLKLENREAQINFLEAALHDYQASFKSHVEDYHAHVDKLQTELAAYKLAFDALDNDNDDDDDDDGTVSTIKAAGNRPRVIKPIRGQRGADAVTPHKSKCAEVPVTPTPVLRPMATPQTPDADATLPASPPTSTSSPAGWFMGAMNRLTPMPRPKSVPSIFSRGAPGGDNLVD